MSRLLIVLATFLSTFLSIVSAQDLLKESDVKQIMKQILDQHLGNKAVSGKVFQNSIIVFINQFDPDRIYLLENEVAPFTHLTDAELDKFVEEYAHNQFTIYERLNKVFQQAILRSRNLRKEIEEEVKNRLFTLPTSKKIPEAFPVNEAELRENILVDLENYVHAQKTRYGEAIAKAKKDLILKNYEESLRETESQYLYQNEKGVSLPEQEAQNLFSIHILKSLASSLDSHTSFYQEKEAFDIRLRLKKEFQGLGIGLAETVNGPVIRSILPNGPAAKEGTIRVGDQLLKISGKETADLPFEKVMEELHDEAVSQVDLVLKHPAIEGHPEKIYEVKLNRQQIVVNKDRVDIQSVKFSDGFIGIITLHSFYQGDEVSSEKDIRQAIHQLEKQGKLKGLILDLRDNRGGFLTQAVKVAGLFITNGIIVISKYDNGTVNYYRDVDGKTAFDGPLVVLTSKITASAAEIVAQSLQDYGVALIVGDERTYGKGTIQTQTVTDNQSASYFKVTVGKYYTPSGKTPQKEGVKADIVVPGHWNDQEVGEIYANSVSGDNISPVFEDNLSDLKGEEKNWYLKYYTPMLQHRTSEWRSLLPALKKNSEYRIKNNKNYQFYLNGGKDSGSEVNEEDEWDEVDKKQKNYGEDDLQLNEAVNIVKDMYLLHAAGKN